MGVFSGWHIHRLRLHGYFIGTALLTLCGIFPDIDTACTLPCMLPRSESALHSQKEPSKQAWTFLFLESSCILQMLFLSMHTRAFQDGFSNNFLIYGGAPLLLISVLLIRRLVRYKQQCWTPFCWTATMGILMPVYFVITISVFGQAQDASEEIPQTLLYIFGAVGLSIANSIGLATKLLLTTGYGSKNLPDLRLVTFPLDCIFVFGWFSLQTHGYWTRNCKTQSNTSTSDCPMIQVNETLLASMAPLSQGEEQKATEMSEGGHQLEECDFHSTAE
ncbi:uncharacterized protein LOC134438547 [Engraulis encrasicolus]|uniref:uncharacterized protein LOC134438547 n=1 Tax=Engraulis encrasicolus TaxID=184585 RepID=UPI002FD77BBC